MSTTKPTDMLYGVLRSDLVHSPIVVAVSTDERKAAQSFRETMHWWRKAFQDHPELKPVLVSTEVNWNPMEETS